MWQGELQQEVLQHVSREGQRALARFHKQHPLLPGMTLKVHFHLLLHPLALAASLAVLEAALEWAERSCPCLHQVCNRLAIFWMYYG